MSDLKHSFSGIRLKYKATIDEVNSVKELAKESFYACIADYFANK